MCSAMATSVKPSEMDSALRMKAVRYMVAGDNQTLFAKKIGIEVKRWNNFERGSPVSKDVAIHLVQKVPGLTTDWLFLGREDGLTRARLQELHDALRAVAPVGKSTTSAKAARS